MSEKNKATIVALKIIDGDLLGFYMGESEKSDTQESGIILYRPVFIAASTRYFNNIPIYSYDTHSYFEFGSQQVVIPYSRILQEDIASEFFSLFYIQNIGEIIGRQEMVNEAYMKYYEAQMLKEAMSKTDSIYVPTVVEFIQ